MLTTAHDHYSHHESIRLAAGRTGATVRKIALYEPSAAAEDEIVDRLRRALRPRSHSTASWAARKWPSASTSSTPSARTAWPP